MTEALYGFSAHRQAAAVLDVRAEHMTVKEVEGVLAGMTALRYPFVAGELKRLRTQIAAFEERKTKLLSDLGR
jgi:hypothetical protein